MNADNITTDQAAELFKRLFPHVNFVRRLVTRMEKLGFPQNNPLYVKARNADSAMRELYGEAHWRSCKGGMGRVPRT